MGFHRSAAAVNESHKEYAIEASKLLDHPADYGLAASELDRSTAAHPDIEWVELDPEKGTLQRPDDLLIASAPLQVRSYADVLKFTFGFDAKGQMVCPWRSPEAVPAKAAPERPDTQATQEEPPASRPKP